MACNPHSDLLYPYLIAQVSKVQAGMGALKGEKSYRDKVEDFEGSSFCRDVVNPKHRTGFKHIRLRVIRTASVGLKLTAFNLSFYQLN